MKGLRVIGGKAKGRRLKMVPGEGTRPIGDRVKESLFNIVGPLVEGASVLDAFAGTGSVGIEALSRGAARAVFLDTSAQAVRTIRENLASLGFERGWDVLRVDAFRFLESRMAGPFDLIFIAPPQYQGLWKRTLEVLDHNPGWINSDGWVVVQIDPHEFEQIVLMHLVEFDRRRYGNTELIFYELPGE